MRVAREPGLEREKGRMEPEKGPELEREKAPRKARPLEIWTLQVPF